MKVLMLTGSPKANGNTALALAEMEKILVQEGIEVEPYRLATRRCAAASAAIPAFAAASVSLTMW